jgi:uncharacterized membrane protein YfcA
VSILIAVLAGALIGLSLGALGGGGSILAVPVLVYLLDQDAGQAITGSLVVVSLTSLTAALTAHRAGNVMVGRGLVFGVVALGGATAGAKASAHVPDAVLLAAFAGLMLVVGAVMATRQLHHARRARHCAAGPHAEASPAATRRPTLDDPIISFSPTFACQCPRALKVLITATLVGLLIGFLGVGGGFLVVPALVAALGMPVGYAAGTSLVVITLTSVAALVVRSGVGVTPDWTPVLVLTAAAALGGVAGAKLAGRADTHKLSVAFTVLVLGVAAYTAARALPALL